MLRAGMHLVLPGQGDPPHAANSGSNSAITPRLCVITGPHLPLDKIDYYLSDVLVTTTCTRTCSEKAATNVFVYSFISIQNNNFNTTQNAR